MVRLILPAVLLMLAIVPAAAQPAVERLRLVLAPAPTLAEVPVLLSGERLRASGIRLEHITLAQTPLAIQAVLRGDADFGEVSIPSLAPVLQQGARLRFFTAKSRIEWVLLTAKAITRCEDTNGKRIAIHSTTGQTAALYRYWLANRCPTATPTVMIIPGTVPRAAALLAGQIDGAIVELADAIRLDHVRPGQFHALGDFPRELPWLLSSAFFARTETLTGRRDVLKTAARELLRTHRLAARDPDLIATVAPRYIVVSDASLLSRITRAYVEHGIWPTGNGFTRSDLERALAFFQASGLIPPGLAVDDLADLSIAADALLELER